MKNKGNNTEQGTEVALELLGCIKHLVDTSIKDCLKKIPEQQSGELLEVKSLLQQSLLGLESVRQQVETIASISSLLENASNANQQLSQQHYEEHIIMPIIRMLCPVLDIIEDAYKHWEKTPKVTKLLSAVGSQIKQFLEVFDVHAVRHKANSEFIPKVMKPLKHVLTNDIQLDGQVAESLRIGFRLGSERILRHEAVAIFKYQPAESINENINYSKGAKSC